MYTNVIEWSKTYFEGNLSEKVVEHLKELDLDKIDKKAHFFLERMFRYMKKAGIKATDFTDEQAQQIKLITKLVEDVWEGVILPFTLEGRHKKIDEYILKVPYFKVGNEEKFLDIGCGFPPHTTVETASFLNWKVIGIDPSLPMYLVRDSVGNYATFDEQKKIQYFQGAPGKSLDVWSTPKETKLYFRQLFDTLVQMIEPSHTGCVIVKKEEGTLIKNPILQYENTNLSFFKSSIGNFEIEQVSVARCFNVLFYFDNEFRKKTLHWMSRILKEKGLFICGINGDHTTRCRYTIYQKENEKIKPKEFAFSVDNIRPLGSVAWAAFYDDDFETNTLVDLISILRSNKKFIKKYDDRLDQLLKEKELFIRDNEEYLVSKDTVLTPQEKEKRKVTIYTQLDQEGYTQAAADVLIKSGYKAYRNEIGFVAISLD